MEDDAALTRRILAGDREAAGAIYDRYAAVGPRGIARRHRLPA